MTTRFIALTAPVYWASALINGDYSGLTPEDREDLTAFLAANLVDRRDFVDCGEPWFTHHADLYGSHYRGAEVAKYTVIVRD